MLDWQPVKPLQDRREISLAYHPDLVTTLAKLVCTRNHAWQVIDRRYHREHGVPVWNRWYHTQPLQHCHWSTVAWCASMRGYDDRHVKQTEHVWGGKRLFWSSLVEVSISLPRRISPMMLHIHGRRSWTMSPEVRTPRRGCCTANFHEAIWASQLPLCWPDGLEQFAVRTKGQRNYIVDI